MSDLRTRPKGSYIQNATWENLYILLEYWKNDLDFYLIDITFLQSLIEIHFSELLFCKNLDELRELQKEVFELQNQCEYTLERVKVNLDGILAVLDNTYAHNTYEFRVDNEQLENDIIEFISSEREIRRFIFSIVKNVHENEKSKQVWIFN